MRRLILFVIVVVLGCYIADRLGGGLMQMIHDHSNGITAFKYRYLFKVSDEDMILLGTSRCESHYIPDIIEDSLGFSVYNGGVDASDNIFSHYMALCLLLEHHKPKYILLDLTKHDFEKTDDPFATTSYLGPYMGNNSEVDSDTYWPYMISHLYRYNAKALSDIAGMFMNYAQLSEKGCILKEHPAHYPIITKLSQSQSSVDSIKIRYLNKFVSLCKKNNINLVCAISPLYEEDSINEYVFLHKWADTMGVRLFDFHNKQDLAGNAEYFYDNHHLNCDGALMYSKIIASELKRWCERRDSAGK